ncbi:endocuticle structural glycoprotein SgAbd-2-like [Homalodisca vitripennis]|nr:endocuticle structural glycoprotein SgAbd-2-like [Homalodisca vitripennis]XP_046665452.1 endocuticle structural glycoprotein SgAbd-2-like [Homalodisca vitripennis]
MLNLRPTWLPSRKTVKPAVYNVAAGAPQGAYRPPVVSTFKVQPPQAAFSGFKAAVPAPAPALKFQAAPAPAPAVKLSAAPSQYSQISPEPYHVIVKQVEDNNFDGSFTYSYETDHGIVVESSGFLKNAGTEDEAQVMQGSYTYYSPEGVPITTTYIADENGFQVQGDHLPVAPPLPEAIAKSIEYQRSLPPSPEEELPSRQ